MSDIAGTQGRTSLKIVPLDKSYEINRHYTDFRQVATFESSQHWFEDNWEGARNYLPPSRGRVPKTFGLL